MAREPGPRCGYKQETLTKEIALRKMKAMKIAKKPLSAIEIAKIENEATEWVEKGVQTTTDKRLVYLLPCFTMPSGKQRKSTSETSVLSDSRQSG